MAQNDKAVLIAATGYVFIAEPGTPPPTPAQLTALDPETYGSKVVTVKVTGSPTGGNFDLDIDDFTVEDLAHNVNAANLQLAIEAELGSGSVIVSGTSISDTNGLDVTFIAAYQGKNVSVSATAALVGGTAPAVTVTTKTATNGWEPIGHTSRNTMPEFGFDGGDAEIKGSWQNPKLREAVTDQAADFLTIALHQFDTDSLELYYGPDAAVGEEGVFGVDGEAHTNEKAILVIVVDGTEKVGFYAAKSNVRRDDSIELPVDDLAALPIRATFLKMAGRRLFDWINEKLFRA